MRTTLIAGGLEAALALLMPAMRVLRIGPKSKISDRQYFAAARKRAIKYRLAKAEGARAARLRGGD